MMIFGKGMNPTILSSVNYHYHHVMLLAWISLTLSLSCHLSLSFITFGRSSRLHPVSVQSCYREVLVSLACMCKGVYRRTLLMSSSLLLQQCPACLVCLIWMVSEIGGKWPFEKRTIIVSVPILFEHHFLAK